jgi:undecaprenyl-diphosphatase
MTYLQALILGIVQGLTEFLPISSSAHLVIVPYLFRWQLPSEQVFPFDVLVQWGTLVGVIVYFWKDLVQLFLGVLEALRNRDWKHEQFRLAVNITVASIPAGLIGLALKGAVERAFHQPGLTGVFLLVTAGLMLVAEKFGKHIKQLPSISWLDALFIGIGQALAVFPGISRSGSTISAAMIRDFKRDDAARFSFLMSIPIMQLAGLYSALDIGVIANWHAFLPVLLVGFVAAAVMGYISISFLLRFLRSRTLYPFIWYCLGLGLIIILVFYGKI